MKERINPAIKAHLIRGAFYLFLPLAMCAIPFALGQWQTRALSLKNNPTIVCNDSWQTGPDMPSTGVRMIGVYFWVNNKFYAIGGRSMDGVGNDFVHPFEYDPASNTWTIKSVTFPDNQVSDMACGVLSDSGKSYIYCVGGSAGGQTTATDRVFRYDPVNDSIESIASPWPGDSDGITLPGGFAAFDNNKLYILGGFRINTGMTNTIWEFTPGTNTWTQKAAVLPVARGFMPTISLFGTGLIYTAGGSDWNGSTLVDTNDSFAYDPVADSITTIPNIPRVTAETRALPFRGADCVPAIWVMGGGETPPNPSNEVDVDCAGGWTTGVPFVTARRNFPTDTDAAAQPFVTNHLWVVGGYASDGTPLSSMEIFCHTVPTPSEPPKFTPTPTPTPSEAPCSVIGTEPPCGSTVSTQPSDFVVNMSAPVDPETLQASDFMCNGIAANSVSYSPGSGTITFDFNASPVAQGENTMAIPAGAFDCAGSRQGVDGFSCTFTYQASTPTPTLTPRPTPTPRPRPTPLPRP